MSIFRTWNRVPRSNGVAFEWQMPTASLLVADGAAQRVDPFLFREEVL